MMDLSTEVNKVFGTEMAKLFADQISEEELVQKAKDVWLELNKTEYHSWSNRRQDSQIEKLIKDAIINRVLEKIRALLSEPQNEEEINKRVTEIIQKAKEVADQAMIKAIAKNMVRSMTTYSSDIDYIIEQTSNAMNIAVDTANRLR